MDAKRSGADGGDDPAARGGPLPEFAASWVAWLVLATSVLATGAAMVIRQPLVIGTLGGAVDLLLFAAVMSLSRRHARVRQAAEGMTLQLRLAKEAAEEAAATELGLRKTAQATNVRLRAANEGLTRFASIIAHDLRAPLKRTEAFVQILDEDWGHRLGPEGGDVLGRIRRSNIKMRQMLEALQDYMRSGQSVVDLRRMRLKPIVTAALDAILDDGEDVAIANGVGEELFVVCDPVLVQHVFTNLIGNAVRFRSAATPHIEIGAEPADNGMVRVSVADNGIGIPEDQRERVFEMFIRLHNDEEYDGTGVGLAVCKRVVGDHGGTIRIADSEAGGARVVFTLPRAESEIAACEAA